MTTVLDGGFENRSRGNGRDVLLVLVFFGDRRIFAEVLVRRVNLQLDDRWSGSQPGEDAVSRG
jgi:hypothetical protein